MTQGQTGEWRIPRGHGGLVRTPTDVTGSLTQTVPVNPHRRHTRPVAGRAVLSLLPPSTTEALPPVAPPGQVPSWRKRKAETL